MCVFCMQIIELTSWCGDMHLSVFSFLSNDILIAEKACELVVMGIDYRVFANVLMAFINVVVYHFKEVYTFGFLRCSF